MVIDHQAEIVLISHEQILLTIMHVLRVLDLDIARSHLHSRGLVTSLQAVTLRRIHSNLLVSRYPWEQNKCPPSQGGHLRELKIRATTDCPVRHRYPPVSACVSVEVPLYYMLLYLNQFGSRLVRLHCQWNLSDGYLSFTTMFCSKGSSGVSRKEEANKICLKQVIVLLLLIKSLLL